MDRLILTPAQQTIVDDFRAAHAEDLDRPPLPGTNLVIDDHLEIDNSWKLVVLCASGGNALQVYIPEWDYQCDLGLDFVTDRAGPNGETMPIEDEQQLQARMLLKAGQGGGAANPNDAAAHARRRAFLAKQRPAVREKLTALFVAHGLLPAPKPRPWICRVLMALRDAFSRGPF